MAFFLEVTHKVPCSLNILDFVSSITWSFWVFSKFNKLLLLQLSPLLTCCFSLSCRVCKSLATSRINYSLMLVSPIPRTFIKVIQSERARIMEDPLLSEGIRAFLRIFNMYGWNKIILAFQRQALLPFLKSML